MTRYTMAGAFALAALCGTATHAATLFFEDFSSEAAANASTLNFTAFDQFGVTDGTVDFVSGSGFGIACATVGCVDLDGSTSSSGLLSVPLSFLAGVEYTVSAWVSGNQRTGATETIQFGISPFVSRDVSLVAGRTFAEYLLTFTPSRDTVASLYFQDAGNDNVGAILDRVSVTFEDGGQPTAVPLPATAVLLLGAVGGLGVVRAVRRRRG